MNAPTECIPNIGPRERRRRLHFGIVSAVVGVALTAALLALDAARGWRLLVFLPFWGGALGFFQHREKT